MNAVGRANQIKNGGDGRSRTLYLIIIFTTSVCISWLPTVFKIIFTRILGLEIFLKNCNTIGTVTNFFLWMRSGSITANLFKSRRKSIALFFWRAMTILVTNFVISYVVKLAWKSSPIFKNSPMSAINITAIGPSVELLKSDSQSSSLCSDFLVVLTRTQNETNRFFSRKGGHYLIQTFDNYPPHFQRFFETITTLPLRVFFVIMIWWI